MMERVGSVLWFTGLSGSGKTTTANHVAELLIAANQRVEILDGDVLRNTICKDLGFSKEDRFENIKRMVYIANLLHKHGVIVIVSAITPYREMRQYARQQIAGFVEVFVDCPLQECEKRDVKGLYAKARNNVIQHFTGISDPYEQPEKPDITIDTVDNTVLQNGDIIVEWLSKSGFLNKELSLSKGLLT